MEGEKASGRKLAEMPGAMEASRMKLDEEIVYGG
jgi:hypothetical protein